MSLNPLYCKNDLFTEIMKIETLKCITTKFILVPNHREVALTRVSCTFPVVQCSLINVWVNATLVENRLVIHFRPIRFEQFCDVVCRIKGGKFKFISQLIYIQYPSTYTLKDWHLKLRYCYKAVKRNFSSCVLKTIIIKSFTALSNK